MPAPILKTIWDCFRSNSTELVIPPSPTRRFTLDPHSSSAPSNDTAVQLAATSLIVTCLNEAATAERWFKSLLSQTVLPAEVVIVDGGSRDNTAELLQRLFGQHSTLGLRLQLQVLPGASIARARNYGVRVANYELLTFTDLGCVLDSHWLELMTTAASENPEIPWVMGGYQIEAPGRLSRLLSELTTPNISAVTPELFLPSARSMAIKKTTFLAAGGFPECLSKAAEDTLFDVKLRRLGTPAVFVPEAIVTWLFPQAAADMFKKFYLYARGDGETGQLFLRHYRWLVRRVTLIAIAGFLAAVGVWMKLTTVTALGVLVGVISLRELLAPYSYFIRSSTRGGLLDYLRRLGAVLLLTSAQALGYLSGARQKFRRAQSLEYLNG